MPLHSFNGVAPRIDATAFIAPGAQIIGDVEIGPGSSIWYNCVLRGDVNVIRIGRGSNLQDGTVVHVDSGGHSTVIGDDVLVGHMAIIHACRLETGAFVGMGAIVMDGCVVESGAMVAAGAMLTPGKRVPSGEIWAGRPARRLRALSAEEQAMNVRAAQGYAELAKLHREALGR